MKELQNNLKSVSLTCKLALFARIVSMQNSCGEAHTQYDVRQVNQSVNSLLIYS